MAPLPRDSGLSAVLDRFPALLAPMSGITDPPFRQLVGELSGGIVVSEMIASAEFLKAAATRRRAARAATPGDPTTAGRPHVIQLAGHDPAIMADAARLAVDLGADIVDINFGCPAKKVVGKLAGSALMRDEPLAEAIVAAVARAVDRPVTVKMRLGWDDRTVNAAPLARRLVGAGAGWITVHARTRAQGYGGQADWKRVRPVVAALSVPVIVNGDIADARSVDRALADSGAHAVMIGRAAIGAPWLMRQANAHLTGRGWPPPPTLARRLAIARAHYDRILGWYGRPRGIGLARKHLAAYVGGLPDAAAWRQRLFAAGEPAEVHRLLDAAFAAAGAEPADEAVRRAA